jgi:uncharacterized protein YbbC (DUF1343 family)
MNSSKVFLLSLLVFLLNYSFSLGQKPLVLVEPEAVVTGAQRMDAYLHLIEGRKIGIMANQSSLVGNTHLVDTLLSCGIEIVRLFSPEHGFRGDHDAGAYVQNTVDEKTGIPMISLYGDKKKPDEADMKDIEIMLFDLQDVGVRFYTYISSLTYLMEVCARHDVPLIVLDRPNPNGFYIDGPVLQEGFKSFVGLHPVPVVYGLTIGEYAMMVNGEGWLPAELKCKLHVIALEGYERNMIVQLPVPPSPNLPDWRSVYLYPSLCFFEGTIISVGRGTSTPFQIFGHPDYYPGQFIFTPRSIPGASSRPKLQGQTCYGELLTGYAASYSRNPQRLNLDWLIEAYNILSIRHEFFNNYFNTLAGNAELKRQIELGFSAASIRRSWQANLEQYKQLRVKYLIYPDFD